MMFASQKNEGDEEAGAPKKGPNMNGLLIFHFGILALIAVGFYLLLTIPAPIRDEAPTATSSQPAAVASVPIATSTSATTSSSTTQKKDVKVGTTTSTAVKKANDTATKSTPSASTSSQQVARIENPYSTPPLAFPDINDTARSAIVNILCTTSGGSLRPISGTGVVIDPKGIILTNAHVAQYVLLSQSPQVNISCSIRTGNPATARYEPRVIYMPRVWVEEHAKDIKNSRPVGTGEHDYALIYAAAAVGSNSLPTSFPYLSPDTREAIGFIGDQALVASYPAEFVGGQATYNSLYPSTSITTVRQLLTFGSHSVDVISLGGVIQAQSGSSGGAAVNAWGRMIGLITTTSEGATTAERDLRAITLSYIDRDILTQTGSGLTATLAGDPSVQAVNFSKNDGLELVKLLIAAIVN